MKGPEEPNFPAEWLAAYADGEMDRNAVLTQFKKQVEDWLAEHPEVLDDIEGQLRLADLMQQTAPAEPSAAAWAGVLSHLQQAPAEAARRRAWSWKALSAMLAVTAATVGLVFFLTIRPGNEQAAGPAVDDEEEAVYSVATADEIEILSIEGNATGTLVVGDSPLHEPVELLQPGEMKVTGIASDQRLDVREGPATPMIWALLDSER